MIDLRDPAPEDWKSLSRIWHAGWHEAHAALVPADLTRLRTLESFNARLQRMRAETRVAGPVGVPVGFSSTKADELYLLFVSPDARGTGVASVLLADAEAKLRKRDMEIAWLSCVIGNNRAAHFYEKNGWTNVGTMIDQVETFGEKIPIELWRYEKRL